MFFPPYEKATNNNLDLRNFRLLASREFGETEMAAATSSEEGQVIACHTVDHWKEQFAKGVETKRLVVVDFTASWCGPCRMIAPILAEIAKKMTHVIFVKVDVDELQAVAEEYKVEAMPTFVFLKDGKEVDRMVGAKKDDLQNCITKHAAVMTA